MAKSFIQVYSATVYINCFQFTNKIILAEIGISKTCGLNICTVYFMDANKYLLD